MNIEKTVAKNLLDIQAVSLQPNNPFTWASGIKSPIYCDNPVSYTHLDVYKRQRKNCVLSVTTV